MTRRILFVGNFLSGSGTRRTYCEDFADRLEARRWSVVRTSPVENRALKIVDMLHTTWARRDSYDLAHVDVFSGPAFVWAEAVCGLLRTLRKPYVLTLRGGNLPEFSERWPRRVSRLLASAAAVTAPSGYLSKPFSAIRPIIDLPNAIELSRYPFHVRRLPSPRLVWLRAFHAIYNPVLAVRILARLTSPLATLTMIGADKHDGSIDEVRRCASELGVGDRVTVIPGIPKSEVPTALATADIFLNTTNVDNFPVSVLEALACGLCVVSTNVGGIPYQLRDRQTALLVPPRDEVAASSAIEEILRDHELAGTLSSSARGAAEACDWSPVLDEWERLFVKVCSNA